MQNQFLRSGIIACVVTASLSGCAQGSWQLDGNGANAADSEWPRTAGPTAAVPQMSTPDADAATVPPLAAPKEAARPALVVTDAPPPEVIYRRGLRDTVLSNNGGDLGPEASNHIETAVTLKARELSGELETLKESADTALRQFNKLQARNDASAADYYASVAAISTELQSGTTRGNPILVDRWNAAQDKLNALAQDSGLLNDLATDLQTQAAKASFLQNETLMAFSLSGAVPEDHKKLTIIQDDVEQNIAAVGRLLAKTSDEIARRSAYLQTERANLQTLSLGIANGELYGKNLTNSLFRKAQSADMSLFKPAPAAKGPRKPLVIIRFDRPGVQFDQALYTAVSQALERYPAASFELVAVSNLDGNPAQIALSSAEARKNGERVLRSLENMGVPVERVRLSAANSKSVLNSEVHLYLR